MSTVFQLLETTAARGAEGLAPEAREEVVTALRAQQAEDGGFAGLDGRSDPYYSLFAWLGLRALTADYDCERLCAYMAASLRCTNPIDARCARFLLAVEGRHSPRFPALRWMREILCGDAYGAFLSTLALSAVPSFMMRLAWRRLRASYAPSRVERLPTPRLAAGLLLSVMAGEPAPSLRLLLESRRCRDGGYASAPGAAPDLLATAVACFALRQQGAPICEEVRFIEHCWQDDDLFGPSPLAEHGDAEHTFYALLALGTCR